MSILRSALRFPATRFASSSRLFSATEFRSDPVNNPFLDEDFKNKDPNLPPPFAHQDPYADDLAVSTIPQGGESNQSGPVRAATPNYKWWSDRSKTRAMEQPASKFAGRSFNVVRPTDVNRRYRELKRMIFQSGLRKESRLREYHEKPSEKRVRLASETHRRLFAAKVREKVKLVELFRSRQ